MLDYSCHHLSCKNAKNENPQVLPRCLSRHLERSFGLWETSSHTVDQDQNSRQAVADCHVHRCTNGRVMIWVANRLITTKESQDRGTGKVLGEEDGGADKGEGDHVQQEGHRQCHLCHAH